MAATPRVLSADDHIQEPPDLWTSRLSKKKWGSRVPHLVRQSNGRDRWVIDGKVLDKPLLAPMDGAPFEPKTWAEVPESTYEPKARLQAMDRDGVHGQVLYPWVSGVSGEVLAGIEGRKAPGSRVRPRLQRLASGHLGFGKRQVHTAMRPPCYLYQVSHQGNGAGGCKRSSSGDHASDSLAHKQGASAPLPGRLGPILGQGGRARRSHLLALGRLG